MVGGMVAGVVFGVFELMVFVRAVVVVMVLTVLLMT
jgi:hypothetical protein